MAVRDAHTDLFLYLHTNDTYLTTVMRSRSYTVLFFLGFFNSLLVLLPDDAHQVFVHKVRLLGRTVVDFYVLHWNTMQVVVAILHIHV